MRILVILVVLIYGDYFSPTKQGYSQRIQLQYVQFMEENGEVLLTVKEGKKRKFVHLHSCSIHIKAWKDEIFFLFVKPEEQGVYDIICITSSGKIL